MRRIRSMVFRARLRLIAYSSNKNISKQIVILNIWKLLTSEVVHITIQTKNYNFHLGLQIFIYCLKTINIVCNRYLSIL